MYVPWAKAGDSQIKIIVHGISIIVTQMDGISYMYNTIVSVYPTMYVYTKIKFCVKHDLIAYKNDNFSIF